MTRCARGYRTTGPSWVSPKVPVRSGGRGRVRSGRLAGEDDLVRQPHFSRSGVDPSEEERRQEEQRDRRGEGRTRNQWGEDGARGKHEERGAGDDRSEWATTGDRRIDG